MNRQTIDRQDFTAELTAHEETVNGRRERFLLISLTAKTPQQTPVQKPICVSLVIDRSGSMSGEKLDVTKLAVSRFIRSLNPRDFVSVVTYDDSVQVVSAMSSPTESLAREVEKIECGGSTNLYEGWLTGAKIVGNGGRVVLLSDGMANVGRYTSADDLSLHAAKSYQKFGVKTTTIGIGSDYDEAIMSKMARSGGGGHYFAHEVEAILAAFGQERHSAGSTILQGVSLRVGRITLQMGHFWAGETKRRVIKIDELENVAISLKYCEVMSGVNKIENLQAPSEYGYSEEVRLEKILLQAAEVEAEMLQVRDPRAASAMKSRLREIIFALMAHPMSDDSVVASTVERLQASMARLEELERNYTEEDAMMHRKRSMQSSYNLNERAKAFSSFAEEQAFVQEVSGLRKVQGNRVAFVVSFEALKMIPVEQWRQWNAIPTSFSDISITVAIDDPRNGFIRAEIEAKVGGRRVEMIPSGLDARATHKLLVKSPRA